MRCLPLLFGLVACQPQPREPLEKQPESSSTPGETTLGETTPTESIPSVPDCRVVDELVIASPEDVVEAADVCAVIFDLRIELDDTVVELPRLEVVGSDLSVRHTTGVGLVLPNLAMVGGSVMLDFSAMHSVEMPALREISRNLELAFDDGLTELVLPSLEMVLGQVLIAHVELERLELPALYLAFGVQIDVAPALATAHIGTDERPFLIGGDLELAYLPTLTEVEIPVRTVDKVEVTDATALTELHLDELYDIDALVIDDAHALQIFTAPALVDVDGPLQINGAFDLAELTMPLLASTGDLDLYWLQALVGIDLPSLRNTDGDLLIAGSPILTSLDLPVLETVGGAIAVQNNPSLVDIHLDSLCSVGASFTMQGEVCDLVEQVEQCGGIGDGVYLDAVCN